MRIHFYAGAGIPIHARSLEERPLGGTETGLIRVAAALEQRGHEVTVYTSHPQPPASQPLYLPAQEIYKGFSCDVYVAVQEWRAIFAEGQARQRYFWTGDAGDQYLNFGLGDARSIKRLDGLLSVSEWQARHLSEVSGFPYEKTFVIRNGVHLPWFEGAEARERKRLIFTSAPYRGLALAPRLFAEVRKRHPDAEFHVFAGLAVYDKQQPFAGPEKAQFSRIAKQLEKIPGVHLYGNVSQQQLAREYMKSGVFFYPCTFPESSCITAIEAQAAGCPIVTSAYAALPETVGDAGVVVRGKPGSGEYAREFIEAVDALLTDEAAWERCSKCGRERAHQEYSWEHVTDRFERVILQA